MVAESIGMPLEKVDEPTEHSQENQAESPRPPPVESNDARPVIQMRSKRRPGNQPPAPGRDVTESARAAIAQAVESVAETEDADEDEEIRRLDNQLDHLNDYMDKVEARLQAHNAKLVETLNHQRVEREKRRQSFHERQQTNRQEDDDFQKQLAELLNQISMSKQRSSLLADFDITGQE